MVIYLIFFSIFSINVLSSYQKLHRFDISAVLIKSKKRKCSSVAPTFDISMRCTYGITSIQHIVLQGLLLEQQTAYYHTNALKEISITLSLHFKYRYTCNVLWNCKNLISRVNKQMQSYVPEEVACGVVVLDTEEVCGI